MKTTKQEKNNTYKTKETENKNSSLELNSIVSFRIKNQDLKDLKSKAKNENRSVSSYIINLLKSN